jgi:PIN domain nuclease of toxin-antitoxin system
MSCSRNAARLPNVNRTVLDATAILAVINAEPGAEKLTPDLLAGAVGSAVNLAEVQTKLVSRGWTSDDAWEDATSPIREVLPFDEEQARMAGDLVTQTRHLGLSLGDRACLALGIALKVPVYTAEKAWKKVKVGVRIHVIR